MREILFRGKRTKNGQWVTGLLWHHVDKASLIYSDELDDKVWVNPQTVGQFTGLTDKNGKRIFEGDICRNTRTNEIVSVKWHGTMAGYGWSKRKTDGSFLYDFGALFRSYDKMEVIGNIHDNPELLEVDSRGKN